MTINAYTTPNIPGRDIELYPEITGYGATSRDIIRDWTASVRSIFGMKVPEYAKMVEKAIEDAKKDMANRAEAIYGRVDGFVGYSAGTEPVGKENDIIMTARATGTPFVYKQTASSKAGASYQSKPTDTAKTA